MYSEKDVIKKDINNILCRNGFSLDEFNITIKTGSSYDRSQLVAAQIWITVERNSKKKQYGLYRSNWPHDFVEDLKNGYFN